MRYGPAMTHTNHPQYIGPCDGCTGTWCNYCHEHVGEEGEAK